MIGKRVQKLRKQMNLSLSELADRASVSKSYLSSLERGIQSNPSIQFLEKIAQVLHIPVDDLLQDQKREQYGSLDEEWYDLMKEAQNSGVSKEQFKEFIEFNRWKASKR